MHDFVTVYSNITGPWMVGGDFNVVRSSEEYFSSLPHFLSSWEFGDMITECALCDLPYMGSSYTWCISSSSPLWKYLSRVMVNSEWHDFFSSTKLEHLSKTPSNHSSLLFTFGMDSSLIFYWFPISEYVIKS